ncbi:MAG: cobalamin biosynthesis protein [Desulfovibrio sp.]|nr:cobalamin biosynthesis protein [Desulfovibrio sp.]
MAQSYARFAAHAFLGAAGIAVRCLAPLLRHKSVDAPVLVLDTAGRFVISLLSGHWGGGNALARHVAILLKSTPVITTASDNEGQAALDLSLRMAGLRPLDWQLLPRVQGLLLEGKHLALWDPCQAVPDQPGLLRTPLWEKTGEDWPGSCPAPGRDALPLLAAHWRRLAPMAHVLRIAVPWLFLGIGCRRNVPSNVMLCATQTLLHRHGLEPLALAGLATVDAKMHEPAVHNLAETLGLKLFAFSPDKLARCPVPHPSKAAGRRFGCAPFSVCEGAALLAAGEGARLLVAKSVFQGMVTLAVALAGGQS